MALAKLALTDFGLLRPPSAETDASWCGQAPLDTSESAYVRMIKNVEILKRHGAMVDSNGLPWEKVSGFARADGEDVLNPMDLFDGKRLRMLMWGSPHPNPSSNDGAWHGSNAVSSGYKTNAFESMAWLCPQGVVAMTFPEKYKVEFYQPCADPTSANRILICGRMHSRAYIPMASSDSLRYAIPGAAQDSTMLAMLVPPTFLGCLTMEDGKIDFGATVRNILQALAEDEFACALGVYDCSLEMELVANM